MSAPSTYLRTVDVALADLQHFPGNANVGDVPTIRESLRESGQYRALIVRAHPDGHLVVMAGNHTLKALRAEGYAAARCEIHECDDHTARRINIVDNRAAQLARTDDDLLLEQLSYLDGDYRGTGYTAGQIEHLIGAGWADDREHEITGVTPDEEDLVDDIPEPEPERPPPAREGRQLTFGVLIVCADEDTQRDTVEALDRIGYSARAVTT